MEEDAVSPLLLDGTACEISFGLATPEEICTSCANDIPITHSSQLTSPFLGLPLETGKCLACGTAEHGQCEGHFGYVQLPIPIYHPCHVSELKNILNLVCLKCLRMKGGKVKRKLEGRTSNNSCLYCRDLPPISVNKVKRSDGTFGLELKAFSKSKFRDGFWNFLGKYGMQYGDSYCRPLLPLEALNILKEIPLDTRKKLASKGYSPQNGFIMQCLPVPPNCLYSPDYMDGKSIMSSDISLSLLKKVLNKIEDIKSSRSGSPNFDSHEVESSDLQIAISRYMRLRGTPKAPHDVMRKFIRLDGSGVSSKQWLEKMRTLFIRKSSGFSSRSVITGDTYKGVHEIGLPLEIATKITIEEKVTVHNMKCLQEVVDNGECLTYRDGSFTYAITVGSMGRTSLKVGQVIHRRIMDGDVVFVNRPPSTHKHSLQAFSVYVHDDRTVKINPLICSPLGADFDGDCIHIFYPQSLAARAEAFELFSVEKQLLSSHTGNLNLQLAQDSLLALKLMQRTYFLRKKTAQQLGMFTCANLPPPALNRAPSSGPFWTVIQIVQSALPPLDCCAGRYLIRQGEILLLDFDGGSLQSIISEIVTSILFLKGQKDALMFFNFLQPLLMEFLFLEGFSLNLMDFNIPKIVIDNIRRSVQNILPLHQLRETYNELVDSQVENDLKKVRIPAIDFILGCSSLGNLVDSKGDSTISKIVQQVGFLGLQLSNRGKLYSPSLVDDIFTHFVNKYAVEVVDCPAKAYGLIGNSLFHGLDPYEVFVHSVSTREVIIRSSGGLTEPGTLFKNLMSILRDVVICYDGTARNVCTNSIILFEYGADDGKSTLSCMPAGEPVGVLAATAISNPAYKVVLDSSQITNTSWELMKEALLCKIKFKNDAAGRRVILYMNDCYCGKRFCKENAACAVHSSLKKVTLRDFAIEFSIEYENGNSELVPGLRGHIHLCQVQLDESNCKIDEIHKKCLDVVRTYQKKRDKISQIFKGVTLKSNKCCSWNPHKPYDQMSHSSCVHFSYQNPNANPCTEFMEGTIDIMVNAICPILLDTVIKGDPRLHSTKIVWIGPDTVPGVRNSSKAAKGEVAVEVVIEKGIVKQNGDAWKVALDSCLPVIHLIDTRRSIPYGIQQIQDYLGISAAFDQAIQRLSTAVRSASKGVRKEHIILVTHSMTLSGNVIGFNTAGFRALFGSFKVQVPFMDATLFTPLKCFERAADKCHRDSLSSVIAACSWGKRVVTGTGTHFQVLWNDKQMDDLQNVGKDVYSFLQLVRETSSRRAKSTAYLGVDVDDIDEVGNAHLNLSPEHNLDPAKFTFDDDREAHEVGKLDCWQQWDNQKEGNSRSHDMPATPAGKADGWQRLGSVKEKEAKRHTDVPDASTVEPFSWQGWGNDKQPDISDCSNRQTVSVEKSETQKKWTWKDKKNDGEHGKGMASTCKFESRNLQGWTEERQDYANSFSDAATKSGFVRQNADAEWTKWSLNDTSGNKSTTNDWDKVERKNDCESSQRYRANSPSWGTQSRQNMDCTAVNSDHAPSTKSDALISQRSNEESTVKSSDSGWSNKPQNHRDRPIKSRGWSSWSSTDRWAKRKHSDDRKSGDIVGSTTAAGRRLEFFDTEEERILFEVDPIMQYIKRILHQSSDGDRLSASDQSYILDNVFQYHPDRNSKVVSEVEYVMVDRHKSFPDSRCFFVVSTDGSSSDFSYIKCMESFIKERYPMNAESFNRKYFRRRRGDAPTNKSQQT